MQEDFFRLHSGWLDYVGFSLSPMGPFWDTKIWPQLHLPITNEHEYHTLPG